MTSFLIEQPNEPLNHGKFTIIDISQNKRRSEIKKDKKKGTALLTPRCEAKKKKSNFKWLKQDTANAIESYHIQKAMAMDKVKIDYLCQVFGIVPPCHANFQTFLLSIKNSDWETANAVHQSMKIVEECKSENELPPLQSVWEIIKQSNLSLMSEKNKNSELKACTPTENLKILKRFDFDFRYQIECIYKEIILNSSIDSTIMIHDNTDKNQKTIIQCLAFNNLPCWPKELKITVNQDVVLSNGSLKSYFLDITNFFPKSIRIEYPFFSEIPCTLYILKATYRSYNMIISDIQKKQDNISQEMKNHDISFFDPLTGKILQHPGRGINCTHNQCFDLKTYLKNANMSKKFICPICNKEIPIKDLVYSCSTEMQIKEMTKKENRVFKFDLSDEDFLF